LEGWPTAVRIENLDHSKAVADGQVEVPVKDAKRSVALRVHDVVLLLLD
jgi:hypothetical protein